MTEIEEALAQVVNIIKAPSAWIITLFSRAGVWLIFVGTIGMVIMFRYIIYPLVGGSSPTGASDAVTQAGGKNYWQELNQQERETKRYNRNVDRYHRQWHNMNRGKRGKK